MAYPVYHNSRNFSIIIHQRISKHQPRSCQNRQGRFSLQLPPMPSTQRVRTAQTHRPFRRCRIRYGEARHPHRARRSEPGNRSDEPETPATESPYRQAAKVAERGTGEHRATHPCRLYPGHPVTQGAGGEIAGFPIHL